MLKPVVLLGLSVFLSIAPSFAQAGKCPVINGKFQRIVERDGQLFRQAFSQYTRVERGVISYSVGKEDPFLVADGVPKLAKRGKWEGEVSHSCSNGSLVIVSLESGANLPYRQELRPIGETELRVDETNPAMSGIYTLVR